MESENALGQVMLNFILRREGAAASALLNAESKDLKSATIELLVNILYHINALPPEHGHFSEICKGACLALYSAKGTGSEKKGGVKSFEFLALIALNAASLERRLLPATNPGEPDLEPGAITPDQIENSIRELVPLAARAIMAIYDPDLFIDTPGMRRPAQGANGSATESISERRARRAWSELDPQSFTYWRMGTTSLIVKCTKRDVESAAYSETLILKCVAFPWNLIPAIADSTTSYADKYKNLDAIVVRAEASSSRWVLMPYQEGPTLAEYAKEQKFEENASYEQIAFAGEIALKLAVGLDALSGGTPLSKLIPARQHLDLSPSNIIMAPGATPEEERQVKFIDLGQNFLYTRQIGIEDHDDAVYVAPEVKNRSTSPSSDIFSLAIITIELLSGIRTRDGHVPDAVYEISPAIGRLLDDMLDDDARKRLLLIPHSEEMVFSDITRHFRETFDLVKHETVASSSSFKRRWAQLTPASHEVGSLLTTLWELHKKDGRKQLQTQIGYLTFMSLVASAAWWYIFTRCALFHFGDFALGKWVALPHDQLLYASVIAFSQGMVASKFYQTILSRLTLRGIRSRMARLTEVSMRLMTVVALPTTLFAVAWRPELWAWTCAAGATLVAITNLLTLRMAKHLSVEGRSQFSTVPHTGRQVPGGYEQWWWTMLMYAFVIALIAWGLQTGWMRDAKAYVIGLLVINFAIHYASKCIIAGPAVRGGLARSFATGERLSILRRLNGQLPTSSLNGVSSAIAPPHSSQGSGLPTGPPGA